MGVLDHLSPADQAYYRQGGMNFASLIYLQGGGLSLDQAEKALALAQSWGYCLVGVEPPAAAPAPELTQEAVLADTNTALDRVGLATSGEEGAQPCMCAAGVQASLSSGHPYTVGP